MGISALLKGQSISIDNHTRGIRTSYNGLHIDKKMTDASSKLLAKARIRISIDGTTKWSVDEKFESNDRLKKELHDIFGKPDNGELKKFVNDVFTSIQEWNDKELTNEELLKNIVSGFYPNENISVNVKRDSKLSLTYNIYVIEYEIFYRGRINKKSITIEDRTL